MSYVTMADFIRADGGLSGRKGRSFDPEDAPEPAGPGGVPGPAPAPPYGVQPVAQPAQTAAPSWWGGGASAFFPSMPGGAAPAQPVAATQPYAAQPTQTYTQPVAQPYAQQQYAQPAQMDAFAQYAQQQQQQQGEDLGGALGAVIEYIRPAANLKEGSFASTAALEAGGDVMADDDGMGAEQMLYEGLTGGEVDKPANPGLADSVDAGGQGPFVDVATMSSGNWESDDGTGVDVLVEPGQAQAQQVQAPQVGGRVDRASSYRTNSNGSGSSNGASVNGSGAAVVPAAEPPIFRPARNGAARNGAPSQNGNGVVPKNRITAFDSAAPYIQGTGPATAARPRGFDHVNPPNPAAFGYGMGQAPAPTPVAPSPGFSLASQIAQSAAQVGTAVAVSRTPPQFRAALPGVQPADFGPQSAQPAQASSSATPWILGALGVGALAVGVWWFTRPKTTAVQAAQADDTPAPPMLANRPRRTKASKAKKISSKAKKSKRR